MWCVVLVGLGEGLVRLGDALPPMPTDPTAWFQPAGTVGAADPVAVVLGVGRLAALAVVGYLLAATAIGLLARIVRRPGLVHLTDRWTIPALRRLLGPVATSGLVLSVAAFAGPTPSSWAQTTAATAVTTVDAAWSEPPASEAPTSGLSTPGTSSSDTTPDGTDRTPVLRATDQPARTPVLRATDQPAPTTPTTPSNGATPDGTDRTPVLRATDQPAPTTPTTPSNDVDRQPTHVTPVPVLRAIDPSEPASPTVPAAEAADAPATTPSDSAGSASEAAPTRDESPSSVGQPPAADTWTIAPGEHLWLVAETTLQRRWSRTPTTAEVAAYHQAVIARNIDRLVVPGHPDLVLPGQVFDLPAASA